MEVVERLCGIIKCRTPSLWKSVSHYVNQIREKSLSSSHVAGTLFSHSVTLMKSVSVEDCRITCSVLSHSFLWFGCRNGRVGVYDKAKDSLIFADDKHLEEMSVIQGILQPWTHSIDSTQ